MEMRKFVVELHTDGSMSWSEYTEPQTLNERNRVCAAATREVEAYLDTYPACIWSQEAKDAYLLGASKMKYLLRKVL